MHGVRASRSRDFKPTSSVLCFGVLKYEKNKEITVLIAVERHCEISVSFIRRYGLVVTTCVFHAHNVEFDSHYRHFTINIKRM